MSILIKGMEMPKACHECPFLYVTSICDGSKDCPLVEIPQHGRLIDADALIKEMDKQENAMYEHGHEFSFSFKSGGDVCTAWYNVEMMVEDAPTIIPAEEGET